MTGKPVLTRHVAAGCWVLMGAFAFSVMNALAKQIAITRGVGIPALEITFARYAIAALLVLPIMVVQPTRLRVEAPARYVWRTIAGFGGIALMFEAVRSIPLASATAIGFTSPIFAMVFATVALEERIVRRRWLAALTGLCGALVIATPDFSMVSFGAVLALAAAAFMGAEVVAVKWLSRTRDGKVTILFFSNLAGALLAGALGAPSMVWPTSNVAWLLLGVGAVALIGQACIIQAARLAEASFLAPFFYVSLIYAAVIGYAAFGESPSMQSSFGCAIIVISAAIMLASRSKPTSTVGLMARSESPDR
ncbi:DMT family transporter [Aureimonas sp. D3]|uniref:DMT family transporter n=1 Tax=Aureimonas sp. D3 TaxID=1638164 RepID=UPI000784A180|nr:DMT family transporter [Aureimonas sp. D3]